MLESFFRPGRLVRPVFFFQLFFGGTMAKQNEDEGFPVTLAAPVLIVVEPSGGGKFDKPIEWPTLAAAAPSVGDFLESLANAESKVCGKVVDRRFAWNEELGAPVIVLGVQIVWVENA